ncbi:hypothetical protein TMEN_6773 [Trichophyton mentagrophytes]|nr:hypothetical protein TMEN_6773 [Trichophyton mentagrophytes]
MDPKASFSLPAFISGPHGVSLSVEKYERVLMVASELGVVAIIPYLKRLIHGYNTSTSRIRRINLVWQLHTAIEMQQWLNGLLGEDILDNGYILTISIYSETRDIKVDRFGNHERAVVYRGQANFQEIVREELTGQDIERLPAVGEVYGDTLVLDIGDELRTAFVEEYTNEKTPDDGDIYQKIRHYQAELNLFRHKELSAKFDSLLEIPGVWGGMRIGSIGKILGPEFDEASELMSYLSSINTAWSTFVGGTRVAKAKISRHDVETLQLMAPSNPEDSRTVEGLVLSGKVFG